MSERIFKQLDKSANQLLFSFRDHRGSNKEHFDIVIGTPKLCIDVFSTRSKNVNDFLTNITKETMLSSPYKHDCQQLLKTLTVRSTVDLTGDWKDQKWIMMVKGKAIKVIGSKSFLLKITSVNTNKKVGGLDRKWIGRTLKLWAYMNTRTNKLQYNLLLNKQLTNENEKNE